MKSSFGRSITQNVPVVFC